MSYETPDDVLNTIRTQLRKGELSLFTGAGFSLDARTLDGNRVPGAGELRRLLWPIAFPGTEPDDVSSLADVFDCALAASEERTKELFDLCFRVDREALPDWYAAWFAIPWRRVYTLNVDNLPDAVAGLGAVPFRYSTLSHRDPVPSNDSSTYVIQLNGNVYTFPDVTFSAAQFAARLPGRDPWHATLVADLMAGSFVFVGTSLDEPPLWQHLELRGVRGGRIAELRPRSFLVSPTLSQARQQMLSRLNISWIPLNARDFLDQILQPMTEEIAAGAAIVAARQARAFAEPTLPTVSELRRAAPPADTRQFLLGREPTWSDAQDSAAERDFERSLQVGGTLVPPRLLLLTGTAGTGKSTALMRHCLSLDAAGQSVGWIDSDSGHSIQTLKRLVRDSDLDVIAIDDVDVFGDHSPDLVDDLLRINSELRIIAACRSTRADRTGLLDLVAKLGGANVVVPPLEDHDIDALIDLLDASGILGALQGRTRDEQRQMFTHHCGRQLLVAMIEVTSGRRFDEKIDDECSQLQGMMRLQYAVIALATRFRFWVSRQEVLVASGSATAEDLRDLDALVRQHLVTATVSDRLTVRHRIIAERAVAYFRQARHLAPAVEGLLFATATRSGAITNRNSREFRMFAKLLNHKFMIEEIGDIARARQIYEGLKDLLAGDYHYWLQRGSLEVEVGNLDLADNYLSQARGLNESDFRVQHEWAYYLLKRASRDAASGAPGWRERADEAFQELEDAIEDRGSVDMYPWHILGSQGLSYVRRAPLVDSEKIEILSMLRAQMIKAVKAHPGNPQLVQLRDDVEREYLSFAVSDQ